VDDILDEPPASTELVDAAGNDWIKHDGQKIPQGFAFMYYVLLRLQAEEQGTSPASLWLT